MPQYGAIDNPVPVHRLLRRARLLAVGLAAALALPACQSDDYGPPAASGATAGGRPAAPAERVVALGRLRPRSVVTVAGPSRLTVVVARVPVKEGDPVAAGEVVAILDSARSEEADVELRQAELESAERELGRIASLTRQGVTPTADLDRARTERDVAAAALRKARAELELSHVRAPVAGRVLAIHTHGGERVGGEGILEIAERGPMYAVAEVFETDVARLRPGQPARVTSPALGGAALAGTVEKIGLRVATAKVLGTEPAASHDARVVEVEIRLDDGAAAAELTGLQVEVTIDVRAAGT